MVYLHEIIIHDRDENCFGVMYGDYEIEGNFDLFGEISLIRKGNKNKAQFSCKEKNIAR